MAALPKRVLVVDDDPGFLKAVCRLMREFGMETHGFATLEELAAQLPLPANACLLIDVMLSGQTGLDVVENPLVHETGVPIVFISATDDPDLRARAEEIAGQPCLRKPVEQTDLLAALERAMADRRKPALLAPCMEANDTLDP
jgi:FixJ family two-component response regulator